MSNVSFLTSVVLSGDGFDVIEIRLTMSQDGEELAQMAVSQDDGGPDWWSNAENRETFAKRLRDLRRSASGLIDQVDSDLRVLRDLGL